MRCNEVRKYSFFIILVSFLSINAMDLPDKIFNKKGNLKMIRHPNGKTVFCMPITPNESGKDGREGFIVNMQVCPYRIIGTFPGARYRQRVEHALLSKNGKHFVFVTGAQYRLADTHIKNVFVIDTETLQTIDMISYHNVVSTEITMSDDGTCLIIPKKQGGLILYDVIHHRYVS